MDPVILFFLLGAFCGLAGSDFRFPPGLYQTLTLFLLLAIGLKGGMHLGEYASAALVYQSLAVIALGVVLTLIAFPMLRWFGHFPRTDSAAIAAHYGSVSVGTYAVAVGFLESLQIPYEAYLPLFVVLMEVPAIVVGLWLARQAQGGRRGELVREVLLGQGVVLLLGGMIIGAVAGSRTEVLMPLFGNLFQGVLALFLLQMGLVAAGHFREIWRHGYFLAAFGVAMPLIGGALGALLGLWLGLSAGGGMLLAVLGASASYIAVPAAMQKALPQANHGLSIAAALGITFPFNVLVGLPLYYGLTAWLYP